MVDVGGKLFSKFSTSYLCSTVTIYISDEVVHINLWDVLQ